MRNYYMQSINYKSLKKSFLGILNMCFMAKCVKQKIIPLGFKVKWLPNCPNIGNQNELNRDSTRIMEAVSRCLFERTFIYYLETIGPIRENLESLSMRFGDDVFMGILATLDNFVVRKWSKLNKKLRKFSSNATYKENVHFNHSIN